MRVLLYADGGSERGMGHVMRSVALAEEARSRGHEVRWCGVLDDGAVEILGRFGQPESSVHRLDRGAEERELRSLIVDQKVDVVHVDSYDLDFDRDSSTATPLISATQDHPFGSRAADLVVDPNLNAEIRLSEHPPRAAHVLPGLDFAALRTSVRRARGRWSAPEAVRRILVVLGGTDALGLTEKVVAEIARVDGELSLTVVCPVDRHGGVTAVGGDHQITLTAFVDDLPALAVQHDLVVTAAGTSVWELCHVGVPMAVLCVVDNQQPGYVALTSARAAVALGVAGDLGSGFLASALSSVMEDVPTLLDYVVNAGRLVDGGGSWRVVSAWESLADGRPLASASDPDLRLRDASMDDAALLHTWRNDVGTRQWSRTTDEVPWEDHCAWLNSALERPDRLLFVVETDRPVAVVRWDRETERHWEVSITVAPEARGQRLAVPVIHAAESALIERLDRTPLLLAAVHRDNAASQRLFAAAGYLPFEPADENGFATLMRWRGKVRSSPR